MLDGHKQAAVIVGQNWGSFSSSDEQEEELHRKSKKIKMVDMIQAHQQQPGGLEMRIAPSYACFDQDHHRRGYFDDSWRGFQQEHSSSKRSAYHSLGISQQRYYQEDAYGDEAMREFAESDVDQKPDLKILFPTNQLNNVKIDKKRMRKEEKMILKDEDGEDLLSLRPPNSSAHSEITNVCSSPESSSAAEKAFNMSRFGGSCSTASVHHHHHHQQQQQQQQQQPPPPPLGSELLDMLLKCAQAVKREDLESALALLAQLKQGASVYGDSMQRLTAHFSDGLATRILRSQHSNSRIINPNQMDFLRSLILQAPHSKSQDDDYLSAFTALYTVSPFFKLAHFTANQAIVEAFDGHDAVHVIDLDIMQGFQWPSFIQALASRPQGPPSLLRMTGIGSNLDSLQETGNRLSSFAAMFKVPFRFHSLVASDLEELDLGERIELRTGEALAVNAVFQLHRLLNKPTEALKLERFLSGLNRLNPRAVTIVEQEAAHNAPSFIARFMQALQYYAAVFDSLDASLPQRNEERVLIEQVMFARQIRNIVSCEGEDRVERHEKMGFWASKMSDCGFVQAPLSSHSVSQAKLLLQLCPCEGYRLVESPCEAGSNWPVGSISLGWQDRLLLTASTWACAGSSPIGSIRSQF